MQLENNGWQAALCLESGGVVLSLQRHGKDVLRPARSLEAIRFDPREAAHYPCVPWFNRLQGGFTFEGQFYALDPILDPKAALHGEGWIHGWRMIALDHAHAVIQFRYEPLGPLRFPFAFTAEQSIDLRNEAARLSIRVRNDHAGAAPLGLGLHPFFIRRPETRVTFESRDSDFAAGCALPANTIDQSFPGFCGAARIEDESMNLTLRSDAPVLHVFAPAGEDFFCLEPVSHEAGAFGDRVLAPGETLSLSLDLHVGFRDVAERAR